MECLASSQPHRGSGCSLAFLWSPHVYPISSSLDMWRPFVALAQAFVSSHFQLACHSQELTLQSRLVGLQASPVHSPTVCHTQCYCCCCGLSLKLLIRPAHGSSVPDNHHARPPSGRARCGCSQPKSCQIVFPRALRESSCQVLSSCLS